MPEKWIQKAVEKPGAYRTSVKQRYGSEGFTRKGSIKPEIMRKDAQASGKLGKRARLAMTLKGLRGRRQ